MARSYTMRLTAISAKGAREYKLVTYYLFTTFRSSYFYNQSENRYASFPVTCCVLERAYAGLRYLCEDFSVNLQICNK